MRSLALRVDRPPLNDVRVRRALSLAVDRRAWAAELLDGEAAPGQGPVPAAMREWIVPARELGEGVRYLAHDPEQARRLLAEAGFPRGLIARVRAARRADPEQATELDLLAGASGASALSSRSPRPAAGGGELGDVARAPEVDGTSRARSARDTPRTAAT